MSNYDPYLEEWLSQRRVLLTQVQETVNRLEMNGFNVQTILLSMDDMGPIEDIARLRTPDNSLELYGYPLKAIRMYERGTFSILVGGLTSYLED